MNFITHTNYWNWGWSTNIIAEGGIACVTMSFDNDDPGVCYLSGLSVVPKHRRKGYATALMSFCEQMCKKNGIFRIDLRSVKIDFVLDFYKKIGYTPIRENDGVILMYKFLTAKDATIYAAESRGYSKGVMATIEKAVRVLDQGVNEGRRLVYGPSASVLDLQKFRKLMEDPNV